MSKYRFSESEKDLLKVAKYNQNLSIEALEDCKKLRADAIAENDNNEMFLTAVEKKLGITPPDFVPKEPSPIHSPSIIVPNWNDLVVEANSSVLHDVDIEDLLTQEEFENAYRHLDEINEQFSKKTRLKKVDWIFLVTAIALQCTRQYVIDPWLKKMRPDAGSNDERGRKGNADPGWYYAETDKILINRVPFDTSRYGTNASIQGFLKGAKNHRDITIGHDPLLGWIFGTANILTNTLTRTDFASAHIKYEVGMGNVIHSWANTGKVFIACKERLFNEGWDGKLAVGCGIIREAIHLKSDIGTKHSIPLPGVNSISPEFAKKLAAYGIDTASVGTEIGLSVLINTLTSMVHRLFYDESVDNAKMYEVRTRKILLYSNTIASTSNVIASVLLKNPKILDVGGLIVTIMRLFSDVRFICKVKQEFIESALDVHFQGIVHELEQMYSSENNQH